jgi:hypothetical protein
MEPRLHLPTETAALHLPWEISRRGSYQTRAHSEYNRDWRKSPLTQRPTQSMAKSGVKLRGRSLVAIVLAAFVLVALAIVWRRTIGISESERLATLDAKRVELQGERARLETEIRDASARQNLGTAVERRLGMHIPTDKQVVILPRSRPDENP